MPSQDYHALLKRARENLPDDISRQSRFELPEVDVLYEGKTTVWRNFGDVADTIRRDHMHFFQYMQNGYFGTVTVSKACRIFKSISGIF